MANALTGNFGPLAAIDYVQQQGEIGRQRGQQNRLNMLAGQSYSATTPQDQSSLLGQMATINPQAAQAQQQQFQGQEDRNRKLVYNAARYLKGALDRQNPAEIAGAWRAVRPGLINAGLATEQELSPEWQPDYAQTVHQALAMGEGGSSDVVQSQKIGEDGFIYNTFRDGRIVNTGVKADRQAWFRDQPGFEPEIINKDGSVRALGSSGGAMAPSPAGQGVSVGTGAGAVRMNIEGIPAAQQQRMAQTASLMQQAGYPEEEIMGFLQSQLPPDSPGLPQAGSPQPQAMSRARPTAAQDAQATEMARQQVQLAALPARLQLENDAALSRASGESQVKAQADRAATERSNDNAARVYEAGMAGVYQGMQNTSTGPIVGRLPALTDNQQIAEGSVSAMAPVLKQMFRAAGEGVFTDKDQDLLMKMAPARSDSPAAREAKMANVDNIVRAKLNMPPPQKATNPKTGETLYLRFGQWVKK